MKFIFRIFIISMGLLCMNSCMDSTSGLTPEGRRHYAFISKSGRRIGKKYGMSIGAVGGGANNGIWLMSLDFQRYGLPLDIQQSRKLLVACMEEFLNDVNKDEELRPYLRDFPFSVNNIDMGIINYKEDGHDIYDPYITTISANNGKINYFTYDEINPHRYKSEFTETYQEAVAILKKEQEISPETN